MNHITIELCTEDRARLDKIIEALEKSRPHCENCVQLVNDLCHIEKSAETPQAPTEDATPKQTQPEAKKPTEPKNENVSPAPEVSEEDIRSKYMSLAATPKKKEAATLIKLYANKISDIPADKRAEVLEKLNALEG